MKVLLCAHAFVNASSVSTFHKKMFFLPRICGKKNPWPIIPSDSNSSRYVLFYITDRCRHDKNASLKCLYDECFWHFLYSLVFNVSSSVTNVDTVFYAETVFANYLADHNYAFLMAYHFSDVIKNVYPDSTNKHKGACERTKTTNQHVSYRKVFCYDRPHANKKKKLVLC